MSELEAGRELDALVAEKVMGWEFQQSSPDPKRYFCREYGNDAGWWLVPPTGVFSNGWRCATCSPPPEYSTDIAAAWEVVEKLRANGVDVWLVSDKYGDGRQIWNCFVGDEEDIWDYPDDETTFGQFLNLCVEAETAPLAICRAALKAVGAEP